MDVDGNIANEIPVEDEPTWVGPFEHDKSKKNKEMEIHSPSPTFPPDPDQSCRHPHHKDWQPGQWVGGGRPEPVQHINSIKWEALEVEQNDDQGR